MGSSKAAQVSRRGKWSYLPFRHHAASQGGQSESVTAKQEQEQARSTDNAEPTEGCTNEPGRVRDAWSVIVT